MSTVGKSMQLQWGLLMRDLYKGAIIANLEFFLFLLPSLNIQLANRLDGVHVIIRGRLHTAISAKYLTIKCEVIFSNILFANTK